MDINYIKPSQRHRTYMPGLALALVFLISLEAVYGQSAWTVKYSNCEDVDTTGTKRYYSCLGEPLPLLRPNVSVFNLTVDPRNATCGDTSQFFCTLGILRTCGYCDKSNKTLAHPIESMIDYRADSTADTDSYWQSITWAYANARPEVTITLNFNRLYIIADNIVVTFKSARPQQMILDKSIDYGQTWTVLQYYNKTCKQMYDTGTAARATTISAPDVVMCSEAFSGDYPYSDGQVLFDVNKDRYGLFIGETFTDYRGLFDALNRTRLPEFLSFTNLRFRLIYPATDGSEALKQTADLQRFYYGISDINLVAGCHCNLHGKRCIPKDGRMICDCQHNTEGDSCERCKPLYNNRPWKPGFYLPYPGGTANECEMCQCYNHSTSCTYNAQLGRASCNACMHNTVGTNCEACMMGYYRNSSLPLEHQEVCQLCRCEPLGVLSGDLTCGAVDGKCNCKAQVTGRRCDECVDGFYGLLMTGSQGTCKPCSCNLAGTVSGSNVCDKQTGQCPCKMSIEGRDCGVCRDGFYNYPPANNFNQECADCGCDPGGSRNLSCNGGRDPCQCRPFITGNQCNSPLSGYFVPSLDYDSFKPGGRRCAQIEYDVVRVDAPYTEKNYDVCREGELTTFPNAVPYGQPFVTGVYYPSLRYNLNSTLPWKSATLTITVLGTNTGLNVSLYQPEPGKPLTSTCSQLPQFLNVVRMTNLTAGMGQTFISPTPVTMDVRCTYSTVLTLDQSTNTTQSIMIDSLVLLPDHKNTLIYQRERNAATKLRYDGCMTMALSSSTRLQALTDLTCRQFAFSSMAERFQKALPCDCDGVGTVSGVQCDAVGGLCRCRYGVGGRRCDSCLPGYYGFSASGCIPCNCDGQGSLRGVCNETTGQCPCRTNVASLGELNAFNRVDDLRCSACRADYFGLSTGQGCQACNCSAVGRNATSQCSDAGVCPCKATIGGAKCDQCLSGYYRFSAEGCLSCNCSRDGAVVPDCHQTTGVCSCKANAVGNKCDQCASQSFNLQASNKDGCQKCFCYGHGSQCTSASGFVQLIINSESTDSWPAVPSMLTHLSAPSIYLSNADYAYGRWLNFTVQLSRPDNNVTLPNNQLVYMEGSGRRIYYRDVNFTVSYTPQLYSLSLHHSGWVMNDTTITAVDAFAMSSVLNDLKLLAIQRRFDNVYVEISNVSLVTATARNGSTDPRAIPVDHVENCTCITTRYVAGLSCEKCAQGYRRATTTFTPFNDCTACLCNGRTDTTPPVCNELSGVCLNCRNGTTGPQCQSCSSNVTVSSDCRNCDLGFWGLGADGCRPCTCQTLGSLMTSQCDVTSGQCQCKQNVAGRDCEKCADNYAFMNIAGCTACDNCYVLVGKEVIDLRSKKDNLTMIYQVLKSQDNNYTGIGAFKIRYDAVRNNLTQLFIYLTDAASLQFATAADITRMEALLASMRNLLYNIYPQSANKTSTSLDKSVLLLSLCFQSIEETTRAQEDTYRRVTYEIPMYSDILTRLVISLQYVVNQLKGSSDTTVVGIQGLNTTVEAMESIATNSSAVSTITYQLTQEAAQNRMQLEREVIVAEQLVITVNRTADAALGSSGTAGSAAQAVLREAEGYLSRVNSMTALTLDTAQLKPSIDRDRSDAASINAEAVAAQRNAQTILNQAYTARGQTNLLVSQVAQVRLQSDSQYSRIRGIEDRADDALQRAANTSKDAARMLDIMKNFDKKALDLQVTGNASLRLIPQITASSNQALTTSSSVQTSVQQASNTAADALKTSQDAMQITNSTATTIIPIVQRSNQLLNESSVALNDIDTKYNTVRQANITTVAPLASSLSSLVTQINAVESRVNTAKAAATNATTLIQGTMTQLDQLLRQLQTSAQPVDSAAITQLQVQSAQLRADYDRMGLKDMVDKLSKSVADQKAWMANMMNKRQDLSDQVTRLRALQQKLM